MQEIWYHFSLSKSLDIKKGIKKQVNHIGIIIGSMVSEYIGFLYTTFTIIWIKIENHFLVKSCFGNLQYFFYSFLLFHCAHGEHYFFLIITQIRRVRVVLVIIQHTASQQQHLLFSTLAHYVQFLSRSSCGMLCFRQVFLHKL